MANTNKKGRSSAVITFDDKRPAETVSQMRSRLRRTDSTVSQAIIAYRTLSITVSESQAKGVKSKKKVAKDLVEGKAKKNTHIRIFFLKHFLILRFN